MTIVRSITPQIAVFTASANTRPVGLAAASIADRAGCPGTNERSAIFRQQRSRGMVIVAKKP